MNCPACQSSNDPDSEACFQCGRSLTLVARGTRLAGRYEVLELLGKGGMGVVYRAHDEALDEIVALKVLRPDVGADERLTRRFRSEIKLARRVSHPNVCRIHDYDEADGLSYISMAYVDGVDLRELLRQRGSGLPPEEAFPVALQIADGLCAIHDTGVIHRDLKTPNIMRDSHGMVHVMDFGIAKEAGGGDGGLTATGVVMGTPEYMSPEQCRGDKLDLRSDVYALGIVLFELFTGDVPFRGDTVVATLFKQIKDEPPFAGPLGACLPAALLPVLRKALAKEPDDRYASVAAMRADIEAAHQRFLRAPDETAPHAVPVAPGTGRGTTAPVPRPSTGATIAAPAPTPPPRERREEARMSIPVDVLLSRLDESGAVVERERSLAEDVARHGARVLTALRNVHVGDTLIVEEVGGAFRSRASVRNEHKGTDGVLRLGLRFLDQAVPESLLPAETPRPRPRRRPVLPPTPPPAPPPAVERRTQPRLNVYLDLKLRRGDGLEEQRTIADDLSRGGARVLTSLESIGVGDVVELEEVGGDFRTRASVCHRTPGRDGVHRLGLKFLDHPAPDRLVGKDDTPREATPARAAAAVDAQAVARRRLEVIDFYQALAHKNHFEVLGLPRASTEADVRAAFAQLARKFHPDKAHEPALADLSPELHAIFVRLGAAFEVLSKAATRAEYEQRLGPSYATPARAAAGPPPPVAPSYDTPAGPPHVLDPAEELLLFEHSLRAGRRLLDAGQPWDAVQALESALGLARTPTQRQLARVALARAVLKNPKWVRRAEQLLQGTLDEEPKDCEALLLLASIYKNGGLTRRAMRLLRQVLELQPNHAEARAELDALEAGGTL